MAETKRVFISSTALDLPLHRDKVMEACLSAEMMPIRMDDWAAEDADALEVSLGRVDQADLYVGIFAHRYGYVPAGAEISITQMEYERAVENGIPRLVFLMHHDHLIRISDVEFGPGKDKLDTLKQRLQRERVCRFFRNPDELQARVIQSLMKHQGPGPVSISDVGGALAGREPAAVGGAASPAPTAEPREAPAPIGTLPPAVGAGETICVYYLVAYSADGRRWQPVPADGRVPQGTRLRVVFRPETPCHVLLLIETINHQQERFQLHHLGPIADEDSPEATAVAASAEWQTIPQGMFLKEQVPDEVSAWRIGLLLGTKPPKRLFSALLARERPSDSSEEFEGADSQAAFRDWIASVDNALPPANRIRCQPVTEKIFGLGIDGSVQAFRVSGRESIIHWSEVRFE
ncbi:MAG TPA: DUF4062 domain-containing protein [Thermoguttaceae bacterium]|nr:DUF4062 domain-containing protein [Thermoguttaceae bacterium]